MQGWSHLFLIRLRNVDHCKYHQCICHSVKERMNEIIANQIDIYRPGLK